MPDLYQDRIDYLEENNPAAYQAELDRVRAIQAEVQRKRTSPPFPPDPLPEGQTGVIVLSGYSKVEVATNSGWSAEGGWPDK